MSDNEIVKRSKMDGFTRVLTRFGEWAGKQKHISSVRDAFSALLPLIIAGSVATMMNSVFIEEYGLLASFFDFEGSEQAYQNWITFSMYVSPIFNAMANASMNLFALYISFLLGYYLMGAYGGDRILGGAMSLATFFVLDPMAAGGSYSLGAQLSESGETTYSIVFIDSNTYLGAQGLIFAMFAGITTPMLLNSLSKVDAIKIRMPDGVPPIVAKSLNLLIPCILAILIFACIQPIWGGIMYAAGPGKTTFGEVFPEANTISPELANEVVNDVQWYYLINGFYKILVSPFMSLGQSWAAVFLIESLNAGFYFFGIHGTAVMGPVINVLWSPLLLQNVEAFGHWGPDVFASDFVVTQQLINDLPATASNTLPVGFTLAQFTDGSQNGFCMMGGSGSLLALLVILSIFSKVPQQRTIANVALPTSIFNISEPTLFGLPVALNPVYWAPYTFTAGFQGLAVLWITQLGLMNEVVVVVPWTAPAILGGFLATMDWRSIFWSIAIFALAIVIYLPFALADIKKQVGELANSNNMTIEEYKKYSDNLYTQQKNERITEKPIDKVDNKLVKLEEKVEKLNLHIETQNGLLDQIKNVYDKYISDSKTNLSIYKKNNDEKGISTENKNITKFETKKSNIKDKYLKKISKFENEIKKNESEMELINKNEMPLAEKESEKLKIELEEKNKTKKAKHDEKKSKKNKNK